jgi:CBS domain-containing protein
MSTAVITARESDSVAWLRGEMRRARVQHAPVVDDPQHVVGIDCERDLTTRLPSAARVGGVMARDVITARPNDSAEYAAWVLLESGFRSLPVLGDSEQLIGMVTERDLRDVGAHRTA